MKQSKNGKKEMKRKRKTFSSLNMERERLFLILLIVIQKFILKKEKFNQNSYLVIMKNCPITLSLIFLILLVTVFKHDCVDVIIYS